MEAEFLIQVFASNINTLGSDVFTFTAPSVITSDELALDAVDLINVYPNPYYAYNSKESNRFDKIVTFSHLPQKAKIKIFTLDGTIVRTLSKDDASQDLDWDLRNEKNLPVASGPYIVHIDLSDNAINLGEKILKLYIIQRNQVIQYY